MEHKPDKSLSATCGLFCPSCRFYIASTEEPELLKNMAERMHCSPETIECHGCRSDKLGYYCEKNCKMRGCAAEKGQDFCGGCGEFPCHEVEAFKAERPHRAEIYENQARIKEAGYETWYDEAVQRYSCPKCGAINSAYDLACRKCGNVPSCEYVKIHEEEIKNALNRSK
jgi:predicted RNA-binding Zn-ribbon protein involved in translation (DUF1610 family)